MMAVATAATSDIGAGNARAASAEPEGPPPNPEPRKSSFTPPPNSCNAHCHIYGPFSRYPLPEDRSFTPNEAPEAELRRIDDHFGFARAVLVQSQGHGWDHQPAIDALAAGRGRYRAVALVRADTSPDEVARLNGAGFCGARFSFMTHLGFPDLSNVRAAMALVRPYDWHVAIHVSGHGLVDMEGFIRSIDAPVVIDHMGQPDTGRVWVKLSGADRLSHQKAPYADALPVARSIAAHAPERILWGSDWPHVNLDGPMTDDTCLVDLIPEIAASAAARQRMLVDNPTEFFRFG